MFEIEIELYEPNALKPFSTRKVSVSELPNIFTIQAVLSAYFGDIDLNRKVEKILIREVTK